METKKFKAPHRVQVREAAKQYGIPSETLYREIRAGRLKAIVRGGCKRGLRLSDSAMAKWFDSAYEPYVWEGGER